ncbi:MAG: hypothetical protein Q7U39_12160 [Nitrospira sp.]|nr:hypothetical protein [Nitrospira sp.]
MRPRFWLLSTLLFFTLTAPGWVHASTSELGAIIEGFVTRHFPDATSHMWVVNDTQWDGDEMVVDLYTYVIEKQQPAAQESRYLLLIVAGKLTAIQRIPVESGADCQPEET